MPELVLYADTTLSSPYVMSVYVALVEKQLPFTLRLVDLDAGEQLSAPYRDFALTGRVPALVHGELVLNESSAIIEYLEERFPAPDYAGVLPAGIEQRARARQVQAWLRSDLLPIRAERTTDVVFYAPSAAPLSEAGQRAADRLIRIADRLIDGVVLFDNWCIADVDLALMLNRLIFNDDLVPPKLKAYAAAQWQRPSVRQWCDLPRGR